MRCLQRCGNLWCFLAIFCMCYFLETITFTYLITAVTSVERQFQIPSRQSGTLIAASDIGYVLTVVFLAYLGSKGNRARWIGGGCMLISLACLFGSLPGFIFPAKERLYDYGFVLSALRPNMADRYHTSLHETPNMGNLGNLNESRAMQLKNLATLPFAVCDPEIQAIRTAINKDACSVKTSAVNNLGYAVVFIAVALIGVGHSMPWTLGMPLIDDNVSKESTPLFFAGVFFIRIMGPVLGFIIGGWTNKLYVSLKPPRGLSPTDPGWIGAWWLGFLIVSAALAIPSVVLFCFPKIDLNIAKKNRSPSHERKNEVDVMKTSNTSNIPPSKVSRIKAKDQVISGIFDFYDSLGECLKSPVFVGSLLGRLFDAFAFKGFFVFQPKYLEHHYGIPQYRANFFMAFIGIIGFAMGIVFGSLLMRIFKLDGRKAAAFVGAASFISACLGFSVVALSCDSVNNQITRQGVRSNFNYEFNCNNDCRCKNQNLFPVCDSSGKAYFSPCHAGCKSLQTLSTHDFHFNTTLCSCAPQSGHVSKSMCSDNCKNVLIVYVCISIISGIVSGSAVIPGILILFRSVSPDLRSVALGFSGFLVSLLSTFPSPIVFGSIIDTSCMLWQTVCGLKGACQLYDSKLLRVRIHVFQAVLRLTGCLFDIWVWYFAKGMKLMQEKKGEASPELESFPLSHQQPPQIQAEFEANQAESLQSSTRESSKERRKSSILQAVEQFGSFYELQLTTNLAEPQIQINQ